MTCLPVSGSWVLPSSVSSSSSLCTSPFSSEERHCLLKSGFSLLSVSSSSSPWPYLAPDSVGRNPICPSAGRTGWLSWQLVCSWSTAASFSSWQLLCAEKTPSRRWSSTCLRAELYYKRNLYLDIFCIPDQTYWWSVWQRTVRSRYRSVWETVLYRLFS